MASVREVGPAGIRQDRLTGSSRGRSLHHHGRPAAKGLRSRRCEAKAAAGLEDLQRLLIRLRGIGGDLAADPHKPPIERLHCNGSVAWPPRPVVTVGQKTRSAQRCAGPPVPTAQFTRGRPGRVDDVEHVSRSTPDRRRSGHRASPVGVEQASVDDHIGRARRWMPAARTGPPAGSGPERVRCRPAGRTPGIGFWA